MDSGRQTAVLKTGLQPSYRVELVKGAPSHGYHLNIQVQYRIQKHLKAVNLSDNRRLNPIHCRCPSTAQIKQYAHHCSLSLSGFSFSWLAHIQSPTATRHWESTETGRPKSDERQSGVSSASRGHCTPVLYMVFPSGLIHIEQQV